MIAASHDYEKNDFHKLQLNVMYDLCDRNENCVIVSPVKSGKSIIAAITALYRLYSYIYSHNDCYG